jgi:hypothetical protein
MAQRSDPDPRQLTFPFLPPPCAHGGGYAVRWSRWRDGTPHLASFCLPCGKWLSLDARDDRVLAAASPRPS